MNLRSPIDHPAFVWFALLWIVLCCTGWQHYPSQKTIALLPWVLLLLHGRSGLISLGEIASKYRLATFATVALAAIILANDATHGFTKTGLRHFWASLIWLPVAALTLALLRNRPQNAQRLINMFVVCLAIAACVSIVQFLVLHHDRPTGLNHNVHSGTIVLINLCAMIALAFFLAKNHNPKNNDETLSFRLLAIATVCAIFVVVLSGARSPLVALVAATLFLIALLRHHVRFAGILSIAIVGGLLVVLGYERSLEIVREVAAYVAGERATSMGGRLDAWRWFGEQGFAAPWFGHSSDAVSESLAQRGERWGLGGKPLIEMLHLHNDALQLIAAYGVIAAALFFATLIGFCVTAMRKIVETRDRAPFANLVIPSCIVFAACLVAVAGVTDSLTYWSISWMAWSSTIAVMLALQLNRNGSDHRAN